MVEKMVSCPECGKEVGILIHDGSRPLPNLGAVTMVRPKYDFRRASHISLGRGLLCKACARENFPDGVAYRVTVYYHGNRVSPLVGIKQTGYFANREEAEEMAKDCNRRCITNFARVEEQKL